MDPGRVRRRHGAVAAAASHPARALLLALLLLTAASAPSFSSAFAPATNGERRCSGNGETSLFLNRRGGGRPSDVGGSPDGERRYPDEKRYFTKSGAYVSPSPKHVRPPRSSTRHGARTTSRMSSTVIEDPRTRSTSPSRPSRLSDFQDRMRRLVNGEERERRRRRQEASPARRSSGVVERERGGHPNIRVVRTLEEYKDALGEERDSVVVVRFFATWCKACKAMQPLYHKLANVLGGRNDGRGGGGIVFIDVPVTERNANLHQGLGVPSLPFGHIYHPRAGLVEETKINRKFFGKFADMVKSYRYGACELRGGEPWNPFPEEEGEEGSSQ